MKQKMIQAVSKYISYVAVKSINTASWKETFQKKDQEFMKKYKK